MAEVIKELYAPENKRILLIDYLNMFIRNYSVIPSHNPFTGEPSGGVFGTLRSLSSAIAICKPTHVFVVCDGRHGSMRRKTMYKDYKAGRKPIRVNRFYKFETDEDMKRNRIDQELRLRDYFTRIPVTYINIDEVEADDIIAYMAQYSFDKKDEKVILSCDHDFYQLMSNESNIMIYNQYAKKFITESCIVEKFDIHPRNFAMARTIAGDSSDNIPGIKGFGLKTIRSYFPQLAHPEQVSLCEIIDYARKNANIKPRYNMIADNADLLERNFKLMQLYSPSFQIAITKQINYAVLNQNNTKDQIGFRKMLREDGISSINPSNFFKRFQFITD